MSVKSKEDILKSLHERLGADDSDESISLIEDVSDTLDNLVNASKDSTNWKQKYEENDKSWREKYRSRFFNSSSENDDDFEEEEEKPNKPLRFEDLFKEG